MKKFFIILLSLILIFILAFLVFNKISQNTNSINLADETQPQNSDSNNNIDEQNNENSDITFTMAAIGDVMCHNTQYKDAYNSETGEYDFSYVYDNIKSYIQDADISVANLETTFAGEERGYSNYPTFNSPDNLAYSLKDLGIDVVSTAGNHALDTGFSGLSRTIDVLDEANLAHTGTFKTKEDQEKILFQEVKGVKIAFINYAYGTNGIQVPSGKDFCVNLIDKDLIQKHIEKAKAENADIIVACMHWGVEYKTTANSEQEELADFLFKNGVDIILGTHPHVLEQMEKRTVTLENGETKEGFVIYSLGNFVCDQNAENTRTSIILNLEITKHADGNVTVDKTDYTPIYMYKNSNLSIRKMKLLDIEKSIENYENGTDTSIGSTTYEYLKKQLENVKFYLGTRLG